MQLGDRAGIATAMANTLCQKCVLFALLFSPTALCQGQNEVLGRSLHFSKVGSNNELNETAKRHLTSSVTTVMIPVTYSIILIIGLPANALALLILATKVQRLSSTIFLINLATADLLLILVLPFKISYHLLGNDWLFGEGLCRTMTAFFYGNMYCSILLLTFISIDRYFALVHPFLSKRFRDNRFAVCSCSVIWVLVVISMLPFLLQRQSYPIQELSITTCHDVLPTELDDDYFFYYFVCLVVFGFLIPCFVTIFCYVAIIRALMVSEQQFGKAIRTMMLVLIVYLVCFTPSNIILLIHHSEYHLTDSSNLYLFYMIFLVLSTFNNCIDPFIYYYISDEFRDKVRIVIHCKAEKDVDSEKRAEQFALTSSSSGYVSKTLTQNI
ncbi:proteinase-activated receptor 3-like [Carcharodon carcharias]|uniref:proteinase-activated receptor 3-like n=1 Tax=Carcharodon carcharias TaxID=13397 RepID=UPI001B7F072B|nr:proteinase-activated receptor 3-like [Carcharodon carcharias]XP_041060253.1 proteinase-activated receptor 3-like [Carcharodon carcharias]